MADEAFALSPISARAALPSEEDYAAISEAFMETSRGRWFLTEYAKRNRNADTRMVLDAVARIEQSLAAQKEESLAAKEASLRREENLLQESRLGNCSAPAAGSRKPPLAAPRENCLNDHSPPSAARSRRRRHRRSRRSTASRWNSGWRRSARARG